MRRQQKATRYKCPLCGARQVNETRIGEYICMQCGHDWMNKYDYMIDYSVIMCSPSEIMKHV